MAEMPPRQRVRAAIACEQPDRVPVNYSANPDIDRRLRKHFGVGMEDHEGLLQALGVDFRSINAPYVGPTLHEDIPDRGVKVDNWGIHRRWVEHDSGGYWDYCDFPLREADEQAVAEWPLPSPEDYDYGFIREYCRNAGDYAVTLGGAGIADIINSNGMLRGMEQTLVDLLTGEPAGLLLASRRVEIQLEYIRRSLEAAEGRIDLLWIGEDLGTQTAPIVSPDLYRRVIRPHHQRFVDLAKRFDVPVMIHSCGSSSWAFEDFIEMGISAVDTLQPEAANMEPASLKARFGGRLAFHGAISTAGPLAGGTVEETVEDCRRMLEIFMPGGGYCLAPTHCIQDNSPMENVVAMYEAAREFGRYE
jgi:hypothetical protein